MGISLKFAGLAAGKAILALGLLGAANLVSAETDSAEAACVRGVASNDVLNIRSGPGTGYRIVGFIRPGECGVVTGRRSGNWIYVDYGRGGFVSARFLTRGGGGGGFQAYTACVRGVRYNDVLNVRAGRTTRSRIVVGIPPDSCRVWVRYFRGNWARVVYDGRTGWASRRFLTRP